MRRLWFCLFLIALWGCDSVVGAECASNTTPCGTLCCAEGFSCVQDNLCASDPIPPIDGGQTDGSDRPDAHNPDVSNPDGGPDANSLWPPRPPIVPNRAPRLPGGFYLDGGVPPDGGDSDGGNSDAPNSDGGPVDMPNPSDGGPVDGGGDGGVDGGSDGGMDGGVDGGSDSGMDGGVDGGSDSGMDAGQPDVGIPDAGSCPLGTQNCGGVCVDTTADTLHCGGCNQPCGGMEVCNAGTCDLSCTGPLLECDNSCVDTDTNASHCGGCNTPCASGICFSGGCVAPSGGHVIVLGYDFSQNQPGVFRLAGNSALLPVASPVRSAVFLEQSSPAVVTALNSAISATAVETGRSWAPMVVAANDVTLQLAQVDSFIIYPQDSATDAQLQGWSAQWAQAMTDFVRRGGTIVVFDAGGTHQGNWQILDDASLFTATARVPLAPGSMVEVVNGADAVTRGVPLSFRSLGNSQVFTTTVSEVVIATQTMAADPFVFHRFIRP